MVFDSYQSYSIQQYACNSFFTLPLKHPWLHSVFYMSKCAPPYLACIYFFPGRLPFSGSTVFCSYPAKHSPFPSDIICLPQQEEQVPADRRCSSFHAQEAKDHRSTSNIWHLLVNCKMPMANPELVLLLMGEMECFT